MLTQSQQKVKNEVNTIFDEIRKEREYQDSKWGTEFDDKNTINDWCAYIIIYLGKAVTMNITKEDQRKFLVKVASIAVAAIETFDKNSEFYNRHYDK